MVIKTKQKIVILIDWYLPGTKAGGPVRSVHSLISLLKNDFQFYIITTNTDLGSTNPYENIESDAWIEREGVFCYYLSQPSTNTSTIIELVNGVSPSLIYLNSLWSAHFSINIVRAQKKGLLKAPVLLAPRGMLSQGALGLKSFKKSAFLSVAKLAGWYKEIVFHATNEQEKADIHRQFANARVIVAPNVNSGSVVHSQKVKQDNHLKLFYLSRIARVKNLHYALEVLSLLKNGPEIEYDIYGNLEDKAYWAECEAIIRTLPSNVNVKYRQELQFNEVQPIIASYHALFLPTLNENFGHSIVESLLCGCPVIISDQTPWTDVEKADAGYALPLANKTVFANAIKNMAALSHQELMLKSNSAIKYISDKLNVQESIQRYKHLFNDAIKN